MRKKRHSPILRVLLTDLLILNLVNIFFVYIFNQYNFNVPYNGEFYLIHLVLFNLLWITINAVFIRYRLELDRNIWVEIKKILSAITLFTGTIFIFAFLFKNFTYSRLIIFGSLSGFFVGIIISHWIFFSAINWIRKKTKLQKRILIIGDDHAALELADEFLKDDDVEYQVQIYIECDQLRSKIDQRLMIGKLVDVRSVFQGEKFDELYVIVSSSREKELRKIVKIADYYGIRVRMVPKIYKILERNFDMDQLINIPIINVNEIPLDNYYNWLHKKTFDILFSIVVLVLGSPLFFIIGLLVKLTSRGPVLYVVERVGMGGGIFQLLKFRTMYYHKNTPANLSTIENDSRVTALGKFLRKTNLDELPQFFNVLKGDMSVVGPRPHRIYLDKKLQNEVDQYMLRHYIKPGITGWAQVNGWRGPTHTREQKFQRTRHDLWYIKNWNFWLDIKIILLTLIGKNSRKNAF